MNGLCRFQANHLGLTHPFLPRQSSRSRRKAERKVGSGKKGTADEEEYLLQSIVKMCSRLATVQGTVGTLMSWALSHIPARAFLFP